MTEHTKGPWRLQEKCEDLVIETADGEELAEVYQREGREDEGMATAHLMAAAHDMLAILKDILDWILGGGNKVIFFSPAELTAIIAAVAKATGGTTDD